MKKRILQTLKKMMFLSLLLCMSKLGYSVTVSSLLELKPYLNHDNNTISLTPGTYTITADDIDNGNFGEIDPRFESSRGLLYFNGSNNTFDFTGVTLEVETEVLAKFGYNNVHEIIVTGNNNVIKNLTMVDLGLNKPGKSATNIVLDGIGNRLEGIHMTVRGSYPYGYGDLFGKGSGYVIKHFKHSALLVRGEENHVKNCTIIHRAYGHAIFVQGGINTTIEGCYIEGETRTTDEVLAEAGSGSAADDVDFMTVWGYKVPTGYVFSLQEDGIRAYNTGPHHITGETVNTENMRVIDCEIKHMRSGVTIGFCDNEKYVENCTAIGTEQGYWVGSGGEIVNSRGDAAFGPLCATDYGTDRNSTMDLTLVDGVDEFYGHHPTVFLGGSGHHFTLKNEQTSVDPNFHIMLAGVRLGMRFVEGRDAKYYDQSSSSTDFTNFTQYPMVLEERCTNSTVVSCGTVTDNGSSNSITISSDCNPAPTCNNTTAKIEAECYDDESGVETEDCVEGGSNIGHINNGNWVMYKDIDITGMNQIETRIATVKNGVSIEIYLDNIDGELLTTIPVTNTTGWQTWASEIVNFTAVNGTHDLYLVFKGGTGTYLNLNWFGFYKTTTTYIPQVSFIDPTSSVLDHTVSFLAEAYHESTGIQNGDGVDNVTFSLANSNQEIIATKTENTPPYQWALNTASYANGSYTMTATVTSGAQMNTTEISFDIENTYDCFGTLDGTAYLDICNTCVGGLSGNESIDSDSDGVLDCEDQCPNDPLKSTPGTCGCGVTDIDSDNDGTADCEDQCPEDPTKTVVGSCGCGTSDSDLDGDGLNDCDDLCPSDPNKTTPGTCGCGVVDIDSDNDGTADCEDQCPQDPNKTSPGSCGCDVAESTCNITYINTHIHPNPFSNELRVTFNGSVQIESVKLINAMGLEETIDVQVLSGNQIFINTSTVTTGQFQLLIVTDVGIASQTIMKL